MLFRGSLKIQMIFVLEFESKYSEIKLEMLVHVKYQKWIENTE